MNPLLEQLHDIEGLDSISAWPLALGWWVLIVAGIFVIGTAAFLIAYRLRFIRSWRNDTFLKIAILEKDLSDTTARETIIALSEYLRRIALKRFSREECAALVGKDWLKWLAEHDPKGFDWIAKGAYLVEVPYAPACSHLSCSQVKELIQAVKEWVH